VNGDHLQAYQNFRHNSARHMIVLNDEGMVVGILTRKDFVSIGQRAKEGAKFSLTRLLKGEASRKRELYFKAWISDASGGQRGRFEWNVHEKRQGALRAAGHGCGARLRRLWPFPRAAVVEEDEQLLENGDQA